MKLAHKQLLDLAHGATRLPVRLAKSRAYAIIGKPGERVQAPQAHADLDALKAAGLHLLCEPRARKLADNGLFEYVGVTQIPITNPKE